MEPAPKVFTAIIIFFKIILLLSRHTACSINLSACRVDQFKNANRNKKPQSISTIFSLSTEWQTGMSLMLPFLLCHPPPAQSRVSNPKHAALLFLTGRSRSQLPKEFQREHSICTRAGRMDVLSLLSLKETRLHQ